MSVNPVVYGYSHQEIVSRLPVLNESFTFSSSDELREAIQKAADLAAGAWSFFLDAETNTDSGRQLLRDKKIRRATYEPLKSLPTKEEKECFASCIRDVVREKLTVEPGAGEYVFSSCKLSTSYYPSEDLSQAWDRFISGRPEQQKWGNNLFPCKADTHIFLRGKQKEGCQQGVVTVSGNFDY